MIQALLFLLVVLAASAYGMARRRLPARGLFLPDAFVLTLAAHLLGAVWLYVSDDYYATAFVFEVSLVGFLSGAFVGSAVLLFYHVPNIRVPLDGGRNRSYAKYFPLIILILAGLLLFGLLINEGVRGLVSGTFVHGDISLLDARKAISTGSEGYVAPGLVKLLRDQLLPLLISAYVLVTPRALRRVGTWSAIAAVVVVMIIGGQRYPLFLLLTMILIASIAAPVWAGKRPMTVRAAGLVFGYSFAVLLMFLVVSTFLGRVTESESLAGGLWTSLISLVERVVVVVPNEAVRTYEFWRGLGPTYGASWIADLEILIPGPSITTFASELHQIGGGSAQGNAPLFFSADAWLAFGMPGVILAPILFFVVFLGLDHALRRVRTPLMDSGRYLMFLSAPMIYSPYLFLLNGGIAVLLLLAFERWKFRRQLPNASNRHRLPRLPG